MPEITLSILEEERPSITLVAASNALPCTLPLPSGLDHTQMYKVIIGET